MRDKIKIQEDMKTRNMPTALLERGELTDDEIPTEEEIAKMLKGVSEDPLDSFFDQTGYCPPTIMNLRNEHQNRAVKAISDRKSAQNPLRIALRGAGIKPFTPESVEKYKKESVRNKFQIFTTDVSSIAANEAAGIFLLLSGLVINVLLYAILGIIATIVFSLSFSLMIPVVVCGLVASLILTVKSDSDTSLYFFMGSTLFLFERFGPSEYVWVQKPLRGYEKDIPRSVLETASEIAFHCPSVWFQIEEIDKKPDPFLVACLDEERFYVEVWGEPDFKGERLA